LFHVSTDVVAGEGPDSSELKLCKAPSTGHFRQFVHGAVQQAENSALASRPPREGAVDFKEAR